tara:strand:- start:10036 stop:10758 length:723 start_codon:yes stop_codon:yes gene_type:complete
MNILIDYRENGIKNILGPDLATYTNLHIGDIHIIKSDDKTNLVVLERKTIKDLQSSLCDGRFSEQKKRICASNFIQKGYIIEGIVSEYDYKFKNILKQIIIRLQFKDKMCVFLTGSIQETVNLIQLIKEKLLKDSKLYNHALSNNNNISNLSIEQEYIQTLHVSKKQNLTPKICFILQISQIPGISKKIAQIIANNYPNWSSLLQGIKDKSTFLHVTKSAKIGEKRYLQIYKYITISSQE